MPESITAEIVELRPDPLEPRPEQVERYVRTLRDLAATDPELARREAWEQIRLAGARAGSKRREAHDSLNRMFRLGTPPSEPLDGPFRGILVTTTTFAALDPLFRGLAAAWLPWVGKRFDSLTQTGDNLLTTSAKIPAKLLWPSYRLQEIDDGRYAAFKFRTYVDSGEVDPDRQTFKIDYDSDENPSFLIRDILDELVEIVPGANLGKVLLRTGGRDKGSWNLVGYFALQPPETVREQSPAAGVPVRGPIPAPA